MPFASIVRAAVASRGDGFRKERRLKLQESLGMFTLKNALSHLQRNGFAPALVVDVGANRGSWTQWTHTVFPSANFFLIDADPANAPSLENVCGSLSRCEFKITLLGPESRAQVPFYQMGSGSSVLSERTAVDRTVLKLPMTTLDEAVTSDSEGPVFLKLDVQGYELEVLRGGNNLLSKTEVVVLECSLIEYNTGAPLIADVISFMKDRGFLFYDVCGCSRRFEDEALFQIDVMFVRDESRLRKPSLQTREAEKQEMRIDAVIKIVGDL